MFALLSRLLVQLCWSRVFARCPHGPTSRPDAPELKQRERTVLNYNSPNAQQKINLLNSNARVFVLVFIRPIHSAGGIDLNRHVEFATQPRTGGRTNLASTVGFISITYSIHMWLDAVMRFRIEASTGMKTGKVNGGRVLCKNKGIVAELQVND